MQIKADTGQVACVEVPRDDLTRLLKPLAGWRVFAFHDHLRDRVGAKVRLDRLRLQSPILCEGPDHKRVIPPNIKTNASGSVGARRVAGNLRLSP